MMNVACIDMEGVLIPELWPIIAHKTGHVELKVTTREEPNYRELVKFRIATLRKYGISLAQLKLLLADVQLLPGALDFIGCLSQRLEINLVSDAFVQMIQPFWLSLGCPKLWCHRFECDSAGYVLSALYSRESGKHEVVQEFLKRDNWVLAVGDAHNDITMLRQASLGFLYRPSQNTAHQARDLPIAIEYEDITAACAHLPHRVEEKLLAV
jgi:phosphoserine / homoserine phosphotransferase